MSSSNSKTKYKLQQTTSPGFCPISVKITMPLEGTVTIEDSYTEQKQKCKVTCVKVLEEEKIWKEMSL